MTHNLRCYSYIVCVSFVEKINDRKLDLKKNPNFLFLDGRDEEKGNRNIRNLIAALISLKLTYI